MIVAHDDLYAQSWNTNIGPNPLEDGPSDSSRNAKDTHFISIHLPEKNHPPSLVFPRNSWGSPVEKTTEPEEDNRDVTPQESVNNAPIAQETQKDKNITPEIDTRKTPDNSQSTPLQKELINTIYVPTLTGTTQTPTVTKKQTTDKTLFLTSFLGIEYYKSSQTVSSASANNTATKINTNKTQDNIVQIIKNIQLIEKGAKQIHLIKIS